jgi:hypothetical protein
VAQRWWHGAPHDSSAPRAKVARVDVFTIGCQYVGSAVRASRGSGVKNLTTERITGETCLRTIRADLERLLRRFSSGRGVNCSFPFGACDHHKPSCPLKLTCFNVFQILTGTILP